MSGGGNRSGVIKNGYVNGGLSRPTEDLTLEELKQKYFDELDENKFEQAKETEKQIREISNRQRAYTTQELKAMGNDGIVVYIKEQTSFDIEKYRDNASRSLDRTRGKAAGVNVDWKRMPETDRQKLRLLASKGKIRLSDNGAWAKLIQWN